MRPHRHCYLYSQVGGGRDPTGTATFTYRWVEGGGLVVLEGYNIVGDGTPQALLPILTSSWRAGPHRHCYLYLQVSRGWWVSSVGRVQHSGRWDPTGTATYTHRWVEGWDSTETASHTHRWVEGVGLVVLEGYNIVGDGSGTPQALLPILTGGWRVGPHKHCYLFSQVGDGLEDLRD